MNSKTKNVLIVVLIIGLISMTIVYATLTQNLRINATAKVVNNSEGWNVHFENLSGPTTTGYAQVEEGNELQLGGTTTLKNLVVTLKAPGDSVSYTFDVKNDGAINAKIEDVFIPTTSSAGISFNGASAADEAIVKENVVYSLVYNDTNIAPKKDDTLASGATQKLKLTISYKDTATQMPSTTVIVTGLDAHIDYKQN